MRAVAHSTSTLDGVTDPEPRIDVLEPGALTTVQDWPGRLGYWQVGVPPSGPMDEVSLREANLAVGNPEGAPALEITSTGPTLRFSHDTLICLGGAVSEAAWNTAGLSGVGLDVAAQSDAGLTGTGVPCWTPVTVPAGAVLAIGAIPGPGLRTYLAVRGGLDVPRYLGSAATFTLGRFGGHGGRALQAGDVLRPGAVEPLGAPAETPAGRRPAIVSDWEIGVTEGPHAAPEFFTRQDIDELYTCVYSVHHNSARTGVRLIGPRPSWAREDGGEAGLHPSNIHDMPYAVGALDFTGDTPIILGPDGPSLGGFVCPAVVASGELWKTGQLRPGRHGPLRAGEGGRRGRAARPPRGAHPGAYWAATATTASSRGARRATDAPAVVYRRDGDDNVIVEYGDPLPRPGSADAGARAARGPEGRGPRRGHRPHPGHPVAAGPHRPGQTAGQVAARPCCGGSRTNSRRRTSYACRPAPCGCRCPGTTRPPGWRSSGT